MKKNNRILLKMADENNPQQKLQQLQIMEQSLQSYLGQKQNFQVQQIEIDSALSELEKTDTAFEIIGNVMIKAEQGSLKEKLLKKKEVTELRIKTIEKQEEQLKEKISALQKEVLESMKQ